ncbi:TonB-dependent receptor family protein [Undibacterium griseum]|uniref:TonB-dependent siderophore receptor n=1 Tax=Undibacterium griseum TaxID=2762295 RepID=A0ABR6YMV3_9BURK|nr:TonB-dependent siderophore receptor [Undibacterium griseum]MBC3885218.1 TonB-dependent siderophore receptor [Undibacterium griseum]
MRNFVRRPILIAIQLMLGSIGATAAAENAETVPETASSTTLPTVIVTSDWLENSSPRSAKKHPGARTVISEDDLANIGARTLDETLRQVPGITVLDETGSGILPNIGVRGLNPLRSEQVLLLQDGIPMTLAPYSQTGASLFPLTLQAVESVDVARGGVAVHYGPNNVGGVINFVTKRIPEKVSTTLSESLSVAKNGRVQSDSYVRAGGFVNDHLGLQVQANAIDGQGERAHSNTSTRNLMLDADWLLSNATELKAGVQRYTTSNELPGALTPSTYDRDRTLSTRPNDRFDGDTTRAHLTFTHQFNGGTEFNWSNFGHRSTRTFVFGNASNADTTSTLRQSSPREYLVYGTEPRVSFDVDKLIKQKIMLGMRYIREEVDYKVDSRNLASGAYSVTRDWRFENDAYATYVSDTFSLLDGKLKVTPGVRREEVKLVYRNNVTSAQTRNPTTDWLPGIDVGYQVSNDVFLFANTHKSLRPVQFTQITYGGDLAAEHAKNYEAGARWAATPELDLALTAFRFQFDNKLEFVNANVGFRNLGQARHQGTEMELKWRPQALRGLELKTAYTFVDTEQQSGAFKGNQLPYAPHHQLALDGTYRNNDWVWNLNGHYQSTMFSDGANTVVESASGSVGRIASYWLWNAQAGYTFSWNGKRMKAGLAVNNLFNRDYYFRGVDYSQGRMPQPGRALLLSLQANL